MQGGDPSSLLSTGEAHLGIMGPVLGSRVQEKHGETGESPVKDHKDDERTRASLL